MAAGSVGRVPEPLPPPLPPETRTVGQLVAESLRLYGRRFWRCVPLGLPVAVEHQLAIGQEIPVRIALLAAFAPLFAGVAVVAAALAADRSPSRGVVIRGVLLGTLLFLPAAALFPWFSFAAIAWLALVALVVPVLVWEGGGAWRAVRRGFALARADLVHALGSLATLFILFVLTRLVMTQLLRSQADNAIRVAAFLADTLLSPLIFLGAAMLYVDQEARSRIGRGEPVPQR